MKEIGGRAEKSIERLNLNTSSNSLALYYFSYTSKDIQKYLGLTKTLIHASLPLPNDQ